MGRESGTRRLPTSVVRGLSPKVSSAALAADRCPQSDRGKNTPFRQRSRVDGSATRSWSTFTCLALRRQSQVYQALAQTALQRHVRGLFRCRIVGGLVYSIDGQKFSSVQARLVPFARSLLAAALRPSVPVIIVLTNFSENLREHEFGFWLHRQDEQLTTCALSANGGPPCPGGDARLLRVRKSSKRSLYGCGHRHIPHLSLPSRLTLFTRLCGTGHAGAQQFPAQQRCKNSVQREHAQCCTSLKMWVQLRARTHACLQMLSRATSQQNNASMHV